MTSPGTELRMDAPSATTPPGDATVPDDGAAGASDSVGVLQPDTPASSEPLGEALYNPFATTGTLLEVPAVAPFNATQISSGDWVLPITVTLAGFVLIGWMLREMVQ
jgi:hypothetical protein